MKIKQFGEWFSKDYVAQINFMSADFILDADILLVDLQYLIKRFTTIYGSFSSGIHIAHWQTFLTYVTSRREELNEFHKLGGNVFITNIFDPCVTVRFKGSSDQELQFNFLSIFLNKVDDIELKARNGEKMIFPDQPFEPLLVSTIASYNFYYPRCPGTPIALISSTKHVLGTCITEGNGHVILLPLITVPVTKENYNRFIPALLTVDSILKKGHSKVSNQYQPPEWEKTFLIGNEIQDQEILRVLDQQHQDLMEKIRNQNDVLEAYRYIKRLVTSSGDVLEEVVEHVLREMGYHVVKPENSRDDLIISVGEDVGVVEIKGVKGSAAEKHAAQLMKWVTGYHHDNEKEPKGILLVNTFMDLPVEERKEISFPDQMLKYCHRMDLCLITGNQLLELFVQFKAGEITFNQIHEILFSTTGIVRL